VLGHGRPKYQLMAYCRFRVFTIWPFSKAPCIRSSEVICIDPEGGAGMRDSSHARTNIAALLGILALSAATMMWLFWHYPLITTVATVAILAVLGICARLARLSDTEMTDLRRSKQGV
jgi:hypothetical protein